MHEKRTRRPSRFAAPLYSFRACAPLGIRYVVCKPRSATGALSDGRQSGAGERQPGPLYSVSSREKRKAIRDSRTKWRRSLSTAKLAQSCSPRPPTASFVIHSKRKITAVVTRSVSPNRNAKPAPSHLGYFRPAAIPVSFQTGTSEPEHSAPQSRRAMSECKRLFGQHLRHWVE